MSMKPTFPCTRQVRSSWVLGVEGGESPGDSPYLITNRHGGINISDIFQVSDSLTGVIHTYLFFKGIFLQH